MVALLVVGLSLLEAGTVAAWELVETVILGAALWPLVHLLASPFLPAPEDPPAT